MSQLACLHSSVQETTLRTAYKCLERIQEYQKKLSVDTPKSKYQKACFSLIEDILAENFLPGQLTMNKEYVDVKWEDAFKVVELVAPYRADDYVYFINKTIREQLYNLMKENDDMEEALEAEKQGRRCAERAKKIGIVDIEGMMKRSEGVFDFVDRFSVENDSEDNDLRDFEVITEEELEDCDYELVD